MIVFTCYNGSMSTNSGSGPTVISDGFKMHRDVDFFLRLHRHLPDQFWHVPTGRMQLQTG
jgi:hypothetical protein